MIVARTNIVKSVDGKKFQIIGIYQFFNFMNDSNPYMVVTPKGYTI